LTQQVSAEFFQIQWRLFQKTKLQF
jgi:hypothetical protein